MEKPKIVAVKHKQLSVQRKPLTALERSVVEEIRKRGETLSKELEERLNEPEEAQEVISEPQAFQQRAAPAPSVQPTIVENASETKEEKATTPIEEKEVETKAEAIQAEKALPETVAQKEEDKPAEKKSEAPKPKIIARKEYAPIASTKPNMQKVREDIVREMRERASKDILPVRKEIGKPVEARGAANQEDAEEMARQIEDVAPEAKKQKLVDDAIRKFEEKEGGKSLVKRLMKNFGLQ